MKKRIVSFILAVLLICTLLPTSVFAADIVASGTCGAQGDNLTWTLDSDGTLTISGTGEMHDYNYFYLDNRTPWFDYNEQIKTVIVKSGVTSISTYAFYECRALTQVDIADTVTSIGDYAFRECWVLSNVVLHNGITSIGDEAFGSCPVLTDITLPASLISIGEGAFSGCIKLEQITIPNSVASIGSLAFSNCDALNSVSIPASVTHIGDGAFANCSKLSTINVAEDNPNYCVDNGALFNKDKTCLLRYEVHQYEIIYQIPDGVTSIGAWAFSGNDALAVILIPDSVTSLGRYAFSNCTNLSSLDIPDSVTSIEGGLFSGCTELTKVTLPDGITSISNSMFDECSSLSEIIIPDSVTAIEDMAFKRCTSLTSINIPRNVKSIGWYTFHGCSSLTDVYYDGTEQEWSQIHFESHNGGIDGATKHFGVGVYNLGEETYSFPNFGDADSRYGHCFGMSMTSSAYYMGILDEGQVGAVNGNVYALSKTNTVKAPICYYQAIQGSKAQAAMVAGGSFYLNKKRDISSDWSEVTSYVKDHSFDDKGVLQISIRVVGEGGHAINFLRYSVVNGQERIYVYDNNFPDTETYLYKGSDGKVYQSPYSTFSGAIDCIGLRSVEKYFSIVGNYFDSNDRAMQEKYLSHAIYAEKGAISVSGATEYLLEAGDTESEYVVFELPEGCETATITPHVDNATFTYLDEEYSFGKINDETKGEFKLSDSAEENNASLTIQNEGTYENPFVDVAEDALYCEAVLWAYYHEPEQITSGFDATHFGPYNVCTRAQVVTFLWRAAGCPEPTGSIDVFKDASDIAAPFRKAVAWAVEKGITTGYEDSTFRPNDSVTRAQFVTFLWRYEGRPVSSGSIDGFKDAADIAAPFRDAVAWAVEKGVTLGYEDGTFRPNNVCTRWAVVLFMYRDMK